MKIQGPRFQRNYIIARDQKSDLHGTSFQSSPKINRMLITRPFANNESLQHLTIAVLLINILIFISPLSSVHLFQSNQCFQVIELVDQHVRKSSKFNLFPKLSSQNMWGFDHKMILSSSFHGLRKEYLAQ